mmetsp:Transcript_54336/g.174223  ORF Transcript_54336/g.174223 Transcript_54336/m.174223 type:complete len:204 (+) Transcript_54336:832-1443(+)
MPCRTVPSAFSAILACTKPVTVHSFRVPRAWPPSKWTSGRSTLLLIGSPSWPQTAGVIVASSVRVLDRRKASGWLCGPTLRWTTSKPLPSTSSGAGNVRSSCASMSPGPFVGGGFLPPLRSSATLVSSHPWRQPAWSAESFRPFSYASRAACNCPSADKAWPNWHWQSAVSAEVEPPRPAPTLASAMPSVTRPAPRCAAARLQ